jgi:glycosyltransferase involved in cell wall biosynthesis
MDERLAVIWRNFGPYHLARIRAVKPFFDVRAIELASDERLYRWRRSQPDTSSHTLTQGAWEDQSGLLVATKLWQMLGELRPTVVLVPGYADLPALCAAAWGRSHGAKTILMSDSNYDDHPRRILSELLKRTLVMLLFSGAVVSGKRAASYLRRLGIPGKKVAGAYDVVDNYYFTSQAAHHRLETGQSEKQPYFLFVGRLAPEKNVSTLLRAHARYLESGGSWPLVIVGGGPLSEQLHEQAKGQIQNGMVVFAGHKNIHELPEFYAFAGCFVLPSTREPWGLVVNEAMASGLPVIVSSRCGCADDLVEDGSNGFIVDPENLSDLVAMLKRVAGLSNEERMRMGARSLEIIGNYSPERWASEIERLVSILRKKDLRRKIYKTA